MDGVENTATERSRLRKQVAHLVSNALLCGKTLVTTAIDQFYCMTVRHAQASSFERLSG